MKPDREDLLTLQFLEAIDRQSDVTQRHLASELGVALGLANSYLKRCLRKGLIKIRQAPANRYLYYLTPSGFAEKSRLTAEYLAASFDYYHRAGRALGEALGAIEQSGAHRVVFAGVSELAEIASVRAHDFDLEVLGIVDRTTALTRFIGRPVWSSPAAAAAFDAVLFTDLGADAQANHAWLSDELGAARVFVPAILHNVVMPSSH
ncbi:MAG: winged helix-turn-helix transcriptional regulator [Gammaproteobacteria bacterium]